jgi:hypothetical protein
MGLSFVSPLHPTIIRAATKGLITFIIIPRRQKLYIQLILKETQTTSNIDSFENLSTAYSVLGRVGTPAVSTNSSVLEPLYWPLKPCSSGAASGALLSLVGQKSLTSAIDPIAIEKVGIRHAGAKPMSSKRFQRIM